MHLFSLVAKAGPGLAYPADERHPLLIFVRQAPGADHDFEAADAIAGAAGWHDPDFLRAGTLPADAAGQPEEPFRSCYAEAMEKGGSLMVYQVAVTPAPRKDAPPAAPG